MKMYFSGETNLIFYFGVLQTSLAVAKPSAPGKQSENQEQPSPISVLDRPFVEDETAANVFPHFSKSIQHGTNHIS